MPTVPKLNLAKQKKWIPTSVWEQDMVEGSRAMEVNLSIDRDT